MRAAREVLGQINHPGASDDCFPGLEDAMETRQARRLHLPRLGEVVRACTEEAQGGWLAPEGLEPIPGRLG